VLLGLAIVFGAIAIIWVLFMVLVVRVVVWLAVTLARAAWLVSLGGFRLVGVIATQTATQRPITGRYGTSRAGTATSRIPH
jgi:hypothetical protein